MARRLPTLLLLTQPPVGTRDYEPHSSANVDEATNLDFIKKAMEATVPGAAAGTQDISFQKKTRICPLMANARFALFLAFVHGTTDISTF